MNTTKIKTRTVPVTELTDGILVGDRGGLLPITGEVEPSGVYGGCHRIEVGIGVVYVDSDLTVEVADEPVELETGDEHLIWLADPEALTVVGAPSTLGSRDGGRSTITGDAQPSSAMPGMWSVETEHGTVLLDEDLEVSVETGS